MECNKINDRLLNEYFDNELDEKTARVLSEHIINCAACGEKLAFIKGVSSLISDSPKVSAPAGFTTRVLSNLPLSGGTGETAPRTFFPGAIALNLKSLSAAAGFLLVFASVILFGSRHYFQKNVNVTFEVALQDASVVTLAGDFNDWNMYNTPLNEEDGVWSVTVPIKKGKYQYSIIVDGKKWYPDPQAEID